MRQIDLKAGERTKILAILFNSIPQTIQFRAVTKSGASPTGTIGVLGSRWIFKRKERTQPLQSLNEVHKGFWDTLFTIYVTANEDCRIEFETRHRATKLLFIAIGFILILGIAAPLIFALLR